MKNSITALALFVIISLSACGGNKANPADDVTSIRFKFTELGRETQFRITCDKFDYYFPESKAKTFDKKPGIDSVMQVLDNLKPAEAGNEPDVRGKVYIIHANKTTDTLCVGPAVLAYKGTIYNTPAELINIIQK